MHHARHHTNPRFFSKIAAVHASPPRPPGFPRRPEPELARAYDCRRKTRISGGAAHTAPQTWIAPLFAHGQSVCIKCV